MVLTQEFWEHYNRKESKKEYSLKINRKDIVISISKLSNGFHTLSYCKYFGDDFSGYLNDIISLIKKKLTELEIKFNEGGVDWFVREKDFPKDLPLLLDKLGFKRVSTAYKMGINLNNYNFKGPNNNKVNLAIVQEANHAELLEEKFLNLTLTCFPKLFKDTESVKSLRVKGEKIALKEKNLVYNYVAYLKNSDIPIGFASMIVKNDLKNVGILSGAGTHPEYRNKGVYQLLLQERIHNAKFLGLEYLVTDAETNSSAPILGKFGFKIFDKVDMYRYIFTEKLITN